MFLYNQRCSATFIVLWSWGQGCLHHALYCRMLFSMVTVWCSCCLISWAGLLLKASCSLFWHPSRQCLYKKLVLSGNSSIGKQFYISWAQQARKNIWICLHFLIFVTMPSYFKQSGYSISTCSPLILQNYHKPPEIWESDVSFNVSAVLQADRNGRGSCHCISQDSLVEVLIDCLSLGKEGECLSTFSRLNCFPFPRERSR